MDDLLSPLEQDKNSILIERKDKDYIDKRRAALISKIIDSINDEKLKAGWNIMQAAT